MRKSKFTSICVQDEHEAPITRPQQTPIYATSSFASESLEQGIALFAGDEKGHTYSRYGNPTIDAAARKIARLEGFGLSNEPVAFLTSSGMSAIATLFGSTLSSGAQVLTQSNLYGGTTSLINEVFAKFGVEPVYADLGDLNKVEDLLKSHSNIQLIYLESPANPTLDCVDFEGVVRLANQYRVKTAIDNTFCTPYLQQPLKWGIDFVIHSTTKFLNGHGTGINGIIIGRDEEFMVSKVHKTLKLMGTNSNAWDAFLLNNGLKTLPLRMEAHCNNAEKLSEFLDQSPEVNFVNYPGLRQHKGHRLAKLQMRRFGAMLSFDLGTKSRAIEFVNALDFCTMAPTLGDAETLVLHPASSSHVAIPRAIREANGVTDGLIRVSVGIEDIEDIIEDMEQALDQLEDNTNIPHATAHN